jgi:hypothetical protein
MNDDGDDYDLEGEGGLFVRWIFILLQLYAALWNDQLHTVFPTFRDNNSSPAYLVSVSN